ncbi:MAG: FeoA family protein [Sphingomonadaceae bacterium]|nr:FeoA family protein [Sphingomonadaceae bacterium]
MTRIDQLAAGVPAIIVRIDRAACGDLVWRRLHEMGFDEGVDIEVLHKAPLGDPIAVRVGNMTIALRRAQAAAIEADVHPVGHREAAE